MDKVTAKTSELRTKGTDALLAAAREAGVRRFVAQSVAVFSRYAREGGPVKTEDDPLDPTPPKNFHRGAAAMAYLEQAVTDFGGIALRYGAFYGAANDGTIEPVRKRQFPIVGDGGGIWSWIHLDDAAAATVLALDHDGPAIYNIVDDDPAAVREWLPVLAQALGAKPPRHFPTWLARLLAGEAVTVMSTEARVPRTRRPSASSAGRRATRRRARACTIGVRGDRGASQLLYARRPLVRVLGALYLPFVLLVVVATGNRLLLRRRRRRPGGSRRRRIDRRSAADATAPSSYQRARPVRPMCRCRQACAELDA